jgi:hypothetical protein
MLTSFGTFFAGEGLGVDWWQHDLVLLPLIAGYGIASLLVVQYLKRRPSLSFTKFVVVRYAKAAVIEVWGLFVTDGLLAILTVAALLFVVVFIDRLGGNRGAAGFVLIAGVLAAVIIALIRADRSALRARATNAAAEHKPVPERAPAIEEAAF